MKCHCVVLLTLWPWPLTFQSQNHVKVNLYIEFEHFEIIRLWVNSNVRTNGQTSRQSRTSYQRRPTDIVAGVWVTNAYNVPHGRLTVNLDGDLAFTVASVRVHLSLARVHPVIRRGDVRDPQSVLVELVPTTSCNNDVLLYSWKTTFRWCMDSANVFPAVWLRHFHHRS